MLYRVALTPRAERDIKGLQSAEQKKVVRALDLLSANPRPSGVEKIKANPSFLRLWIGREYRMVYTVEDDSRLILVAFVRHRKDAYKGIEKLDAKSLLAAIEPARPHVRPRTN